MNTLYELSNIVQYYEGKKVLEVKELKLYEGEIVGFFGPNGSGKSTLFSLLSFINKAEEGVILYENINSSKIDFKKKQKVVMLPQNPYLLKRTVYENIAFALKLRKEKIDLEQKVKEALSLVGLDYSFSKRKYRQLSGGEAQRVALAARLILEPKVLILDEPTVGVDANSALLIKEAILKAKEKYNTTIFVSSHDHNWLNQICDRKLALFQGNLMQSGSVNLIFAPWEKNVNGDLIKVFSDGQRLHFENSKNKSESSILMINSEHIKVQSCTSKQKDENNLIGHISSLHEEFNSDYLILEFCISRISFNCKVSKEQVKEEKLLPGEKILVNIDTKNLLWI